MSEALASAGAIGYVLLIGALIGLVVCGIGAMYALRRRRLPLTALMLVPMVLLTIGSFGSWMALDTAAQTAAEAEPTRIPIVAITSAWSAISADAIAAWLAAVLLVVGVWTAAVGSFLAPGQEPRLTPGASASAAVVTIAGTIFVAVYGASSAEGLGMATWGLAAVLLFGGLGVAAAALRRAADDDMNRVAGARFVASICLFFAVLHASHAVDLGRRMQVFSPDGPIVSATDLAGAIAMFGQLVDPVVTMGVIAVGVAVLVAVIGFMGEIGEVVDRFTMFDAFGVAAMFVAALGVRITEDGAFRSIAILARSAPAVEMFEEMRNDLPSAAITRGEVNTPVRLVEGGFGDVIVYEQEEWTRLWRWTGRRWVEDKASLADAQLSDLPPLIVASKGLDAEKLLEVLDRVDVGYLQLRASEVKSGTLIPAELARLQVTFLPLRRSEGRDLETQLWLEAGASEANWGPTVWYGEKDESLDPVDYATAALAATQSPGIHLLVGKRKVSDVVTNCLQYLVAASGTPDENGAMPLTYAPDRWCAISADPLEVVRAEADALWQLPAPTNVTMTIALEGPLVAAPTENRLRRELGAIGYCAEKAVEAGEVLVGRMTLHVPVTKEGQVYATTVDEKSPLQSPAILQCATKRFRRMQLTLPEPPPETDPPTVPPPLKPGEEPPPPPSAIVHLDFVKAA